jgi:hypothetical protein
MSTNPVFGPKARFLDANANPLSGGLLYSYSAGTSTPLSTYTTRAGSVANANPVVLDANGEADVWTTPGVDYKFVLKTSAGVTQWTVDNVPSPAEQSASTDEVATDPGGRLTLTTLTPVTTSDVTGATTVRYAPYKSNKVPLYDGTTWALNSVATELSQTTADNTKSPAAVANNSNYDVFVWSDSGTLRATRGPAWTSDTARGTGAGTTELERVDGRYVNKVSITNGPGAQRGLYVGTIRSDGSAQINDSLAKRHVWNAYHRVMRAMLVTEPTNTWNYSTLALRQANGNAANQLDFVRGLDEDGVRATVLSRAFNSTATVRLVYTGIGLDSTSAIAAGSLTNSASSTNTMTAQMTAFYSGLPGLGRHLLTWLESGNGADTQTWEGDGGAPTLVQTGIHGEMLA